MEEAKKIDPFDVEALEKSLNDSATRVSAVWVSYLIFGLYLTISVGGVTHRQLFLEEPIKLPVLNIDLPLWSFFLLAPILFVTFHTYVLLQVLLLSRTAEAYNHALERKALALPEDGSIRQRLANTLFAQILAGSPREQRGVIGALLKLIAWITLVASPVLVLLAFQFLFLPYHSHIVTWAHRWLIFGDLALVYMLWPLIIDPRRNIGWGNARSIWIALLATLPFIVVSWVLITFPGERHASWTRYLPDEVPSSEMVWEYESAPDLGIPYQCRSRSPLALLSAHFDRLFLPWEDFVDDDKLAKIEAASTARGLEPYQGERTRNFRARNLSCSIFDNADLRRVDFTDAVLLGATLLEAELEGASFERGILHRALLNGANLRSANLSGAQLQGANMNGVRLQAANLSSANLMGATLGKAQLQTSKMVKVDLRGSKLLQASLTGADLTDARLDAARFYRADLQVARITIEASMKLTQMSLTRLWNANGDRDDPRTSFGSLRGFPNCAGAQIIQPRFKLILERTEFSEEIVEDTPEHIAELFEQIARNLPIAAKAGSRSRWTKQLGFASAETSERKWKDCASRVLPEDEFAAKWRAQLVELVCEKGVGREHIAAGILRNFENPNYEEFWEDENGLSIDEAKRYFARALLGLDNNKAPCPARHMLDSDIVRRLRMTLAGRAQASSKFTFLGTSLPARMDYTTLIVPAYLRSFAGVSLRRDLCPTRTRPRPDSSTALRT